MSGKSTRELDQPAGSHGKDHRKGTIEVHLMSFGYKQGSPPLANAVFDVRFLKNPYWVDELRPLTGLDKQVRDYVIEQPAAREFVESLVSLYARVLPSLADLKVHQYAVAIGCTGGQHRSTAMVEELADKLALAIPDLVVSKEHRELERKSHHPEAVK